MTCTKKVITYLDEIQLVAEVDGLCQDRPDGREVQERGDTVGDGEASVQRPHVVADVVVGILCVGRPFELVSRVHDALRDPHVSKKKPIKVSGILPASFRCGNSPVGFSTGLFSFLDLPWSRVRRRGGSAVRRGRRCPWRRVHCMSTRRTGRRSGRKWTRSRSGGRKRAGRVCPEGCRIVVAATSCTRAAR